MRFVGCVGSAEFPAWFAARVLGRVSGQAAGLNTTFRMGDIGMAAFSVFFMQSPSFLAHQRRFEEGRPLQLREAVRHLENPQRQSYPRHAGPGVADLLHPVFAEAVDQLERIEAAWMCSTAWAGRC